MAKKFLTIEIDRTRRRDEYLVRVRARNGEIILIGETTKNKATRMVDQFIADIQGGLFEIVDLTKDHDR